MLRKQNQKGLTLLEYCAGAAVVAVMTFAVIKAMGNKMTNAGQSIGTWAETQANAMPALPNIGDGGANE